MQDQSVTERDAARMPWQALDRPAPAQVQICSCSYQVPYLAFNRNPKRARG